MKLTCTVKNLFWIDFKYNKNTFNNFKITHKQIILSAFKIRSLHVININKYIILFLSEPIMR